MVNTAIAAWLTSGAIVLSVTSPMQYAPDVAAVFMGIFGGLMVQLWTVEQRKPTRRVFCADIMASAFFGYAAKVAGVPSCLGILNKMLPEDSQVVFDATNHLGGIVIVSGLAGMVGAGLIRRFLDRVNPEWMHGNAIDKP